MARRGGRHRRAWIEPLEDRIVLSAVFGPQHRPAELGPFQGNDQVQAALMRLSFPEGPELTQLGGLCSVAMPGLQTWVSAGEPLLPVEPVLVALPPGMELSSVEASYPEGGIVLARGVQLASAPAEVAIGHSGGPEHGAPWDPLGPGPVSYASHTFRGYSLAWLAVFPIQYQAETGTVVFHPQIELKLTAKAAEHGAGTPVRHLAGDRGLVASMVENPKTLAGYEAGDPIGPEPPLLAEADQPAALSNFEYVLITGDALASSFQPLVDQKLSRGLSAALVTTEYIYANYTGTENNDNADKIRSFIRDAYLNHGTQWVLLGGDVEVVPARGVYVSNSSASETDLPTDMYYACLDGPWNYDGDSLWGEYTDGAGGGDIDLVPEVYIGRAPASNATEAANFVAKTIQYETQAHPNPKRAVFLGEKLDSYTYGSASAIDIRETCLPVDWLPELVEHYDTSSYSWPASDFLADLNASPHIVEHLGHSGPTYNARIYNSDVAALTNEFPYFMYSQGCDSGSFDTHDRCIAEQHVVSAHGAFGVVMNAREGWYASGSGPSYSHEYAKQFWDAVFNELKLHLGEANHDSKMDNLWRVGVTGTYRWIHFETNLFGDPESSFQVGNVAPRAKGESYVTPENTVLTVEAPGVLANDTDANGDPLTAVLVTGPTHGTLVLNADGSLTYSPEAGYCGKDSFTYKANDGLLDSNTATVSIKVNSIPVAADDTYATDKDTTLEVGYPGVLSNDTDTDGDRLHAELLTGPSHGTLDFWDGPFRYTPESGFVGVDTFTYRATDGYAQSNTATVTILVDPPTADIADVDPDPRSTAVNTVEIVFSKAVTGFDMADLVLTRDGGENLLGPSQFLATSDNAAWTLQGLAEITGTPGNYLLKLTAAGSGITDAAGTPLAADATEEWTVNPTVFTGSPGGDSFTFTAGDAWHELAVTLSGGSQTIYLYPASESPSLTLDGAGGSDSITIAGGAGSDTLILGNPDIGTATLTAPNCTLTSTSIETISVEAGPGSSQVATLYDTPADDTFTARYREATLTDGSTYSYTVTGFSTIRALSTAGGSDDQALFYDSAGDDTFAVKPFGRHAYMTGADYYNFASGFDVFRGYATEGGTDSAHLYDSAGDDTYLAWSDRQAQMQTPSVAAYASGFEFNYGRSTAGGFDVAYLYDSAAEDTFVAKASGRYAYMTRQTSRNPVTYAFWSFASAFERTYGVFSDGGDADSVYLFDSGLNDEFYGQAGIARLHDAALAAYWFEVQGLQAADRVNVYGTAGGTNNRTIVLPIDYLLAFYGTWTGDSWP
ncbi:MAG: C25 family cysteine peptidase [Thermoguttaceae bacterium]